MRWTGPNGPTQQNTMRSMDPTCWSALCTTSNQRLPKGLNNPMLAGLGCETKCKLFIMFQDCYSILKNLTFITQFFAISLKITGRSGIIWYGIMFVSSNLRFKGPSCWKVLAPTNAATHEYVSKLYKMLSYNSIMYFICKMRTVKKHVIMHNIFFFKNTIYIYMQYIL